uniref:26S proteasome non-ATPase regulatory subunit RPN1 C-terminal domain-containing protein n=1 Tax=Parascaris univalens TaxID=6257 RepID=A0A915A6T5_PARUN
KPKAITGFQTHTTPVLLSHGERAELANDECKYITNSLFGRFGHCEEECRICAVYCRFKEEIKL